MKSAVRPLRAALCDLDGTLLDTAPDLAAAVNRMLAALGRPSRTLGEVANDIGRGTPKLVERSLAATGEARMDEGQLFERALRLFSRHYEEESGRASRAFPGVLEGLEAMTQDGIALACVTNKPRRFTEPLLAGTGLAHWFRAVVCGDEVAHLKPHPAPYLQACTRLGVPPGEAVAIGDSSNDVTAARAAGCVVLCVPYGYREGEPVERLQGDALVPDLRAAAAWLRRRNEIKGAAR